MQKSGLIDQRKLRIEKLNHIRTLGIDPYPAQSKRTHLVSQVMDKFDDLMSHKPQDHVIIAGRLISIREHGKIMFADIKDHSGTLQLLIKNPELDAVRPSMSFIEVKNYIDSGDFVQVSGVPYITARGEKSLLVDSFRLLTKSLRPMPGNKDTVKDKEFFLRRRYIHTNIDEDMYNRFLRRAKYWKAHRDFLNSNGFVEINIPVLEHVTGGADANPFVTHMQALNQQFFLRISQELYLKRLIGGGYEKVYEIGPRFRNEGFSDEHIPEHIALEYYWAYADWKEGMEFTKELFRYTYQEVYGKLKFNIRGFEVDLAKKWKLLDFSDVIKKSYGIDIEKVKPKKVRELLKQNGIETPVNLNISRGIDMLWKIKRKEIGGPAFVVGEPKFLSPLAKAQFENPNLTERFHPIIAGSELGNALSELNDPLDQLKRFQEQQQLRDSGDNEAQMLDIDFVEMLEYGMPPTFGYGHSERNFWFFENLPAKECIPFPPMRAHISQTTKRIYEDYGLPFDSTYKHNGNNSKTIPNIEKLGK